MLAEPEQVVDTGCNFVVLWLLVRVSMQELDGESPYEVAVNAVDNFAVDCRLDVLAGGSAAGSLEEEDIGIELVDRIVATSC